MPNSGMNAKTAQRDNWRTPEWLVAWLDSLYRFTIDGAADASNVKTFAGIRRYWGPGGEAEDALSVSWRGERVFCNPPYSLRAEFTEKASRLEADVSVLILPAFVDRPWFHMNIVQQASALWFVQGRVPFEPPPGVKDSGPRFPTMIAVYRHMPREIFGCEIRSVPKIARPSRRRRIET